MSTPNPVERKLSALLAQRFEHGANPASLVHGILATLEAIDTALSPVLGKSGVAALLKRALFLSASTHPWLSSLCGPAESDPDFSALKTALAQQSSQDAAAGGRAIVESFCELLASMVGASLSDRLLRPVLALPAGGLSVETPPND